MPRRKAPTIEEAGGLEVWINAGFHSGRWLHDYKEFEYFRHNLKLSQAKMCELFGTPEKPNIPSRRASPQRIKHWYAVDDQEHERASDAG